MVFWVLMVTVNSHPIMTTSTLLVNSTLTLCALFYSCPSFNLLVLIYTFSGDILVTTMMISMSTSKTHLKTSFLSMMMMPATIILSQPRSVSHSPLVSPDTPTTTFLSALMLLAIGLMICSTLMPKTSSRTTTKLI